MEGQFNYKGKANLANIASYCQATMHYISNLSLIPPMLKISK